MPRAAAEMTLTDVIRHLHVPNERGGGASQRYDYSLTVLNKPANMELWPTEQFHEALARAKNINAPEGSRITSAKTTEEHSAIRIRDHFRRITARSKKEAGGGGSSFELWRPMHAPQASSL